ncbi:unnamed protein product [Thlaspi arvense]|uniref:RING-type E3 ubiquitin transferase n=1 Tax=Thlaspi arvense TaxID=13288 RepID=A0AAU9RX98_THLAR|nr:unnamed protein product [Thlaspi arvense]
MEKEDVEAEMRRLKMELKQTMDMYSTACKEALTAKQKAVELERWKMEEQKKLEEARLAEGAALAIIEREKAKSRAAIEAAEASRRIAEMEAQKRINAEMKALKEAKEKNKMLNKLTQSDFSLQVLPDHTQVAVKVLRPDAAQGRSQFQQEVEVLSCIRHPHMVLLLGACPEYGCLVYEYMSNGSLEDCLFPRPNSSTPPLSWQQRFRIAAEIGTGLLFLTKTNQSLLCTVISNLPTSCWTETSWPRSVMSGWPGFVTQYRMTSTAGTFCYIDPEYQQTGMLGVKSDIYSLGIMYLQLITGKPPMGLTHHVERAIEKGTFWEMLDPVVPDWPVEEALSFAKLSLMCAELRRKDRPDLAKVVMPELERLRTLAEESLIGGFDGGIASLANFSQGSKFSLVVTELEKSAVT